MKKILVPIIVLLLSVNSYAQVGIGTENPNPNSALEISSTDKGMIIPRMTEAERLAIAVDAYSAGLMVYEIDVEEGFWYFDGTGWNKIFADDETGKWETSGDDIYNSNIGNVGIGTAGGTITAPLHVKGSTIFPFDGENILYYNDFTSGDTLNNYSDTGNNCSDSESEWYIYPDSPSGATMYGAQAYIEAANWWECSTTDKLLIEGPFVPTTTSVDISFAYYYSHDSGSSANLITLYNQTTNSVAAVLVGNQDGDLDEVYSGTHTIIPGNSYFLRFRFESDHFNYAEIDNIEVKEYLPPVTGVYTFRLEDGTEGAGKVLTSDANGNAYWASPSSLIDKPSTNSFLTEILTEKKVNNQEKWVNHIGMASLNNGEIHITLTDDFQNKININGQSKLYVFLQESGNSNGLYVIIDEDKKGFTVKEKNGGTSNIPFSYTVVAENKNSAKNKIILYNINNSIKE